MKTKDLTNKNPPFSKGDTIILKPQHKKYSKPCEDLYNKPKIVERCFIKNLGDMEVSVVYLENDTNNPYLAKLFIAL